MNHYTVIWDGTDRRPGGRYLSVDPDAAVREAPSMPRHRAQQLLNELVVDVVRKIGPSPMPAILRAMPPGTSLESARRAVYRAALLGRLRYTMREVLPGLVARVYEVTT